MAESGLKRVRWLVLSVSLLTLSIPISMDVMHIVREGKAAASQGGVQSLELLAQRLLGDTGQDGLRALFDPAVFEAAATNYGRERGLDAFEASVALYTSAFVALFEHGKNALEVRPAPDDAALSAALPALRADIVGALPETYGLVRTEDGWRNPYRLFPGPWPDKMGPIIFRCFTEPLDLSPQNRSAPDALTITNHPGELARIGLPAPRDEVVYVWSNGLNRVSDQPHYDPSHVYAPPASAYYVNGETIDHLGGGDDFVSWDAEYSCWYHYSN